MNNARNDVSSAAGGKKMAPPTQVQIAELLDASGINVPVSVTMPKAVVPTMTSSKLDIADVLTPEELAKVISGERTLNVLSWGVGRDSTVLGVALAEKVIDLPIDAVMVANVGDGNETPETYSTFEFYKRYFEEKGIPLIVVFNRYGKSLEEYVLDKKTFPSKKRRDCTGKFKIAAMRQYLRGRFGDKARFVKYIGYNKDEEDRLANAQAVKNPSYEILQYPLVTAGITRAMEAPFLEERGLPVPSKSGCFFCPYTRQAGWIWLYQNHRDLFMRSMFMEEQSNDLTKGWTITSRPKWAEAIGMGSLRSLVVRIERGEFTAKFETDDRGRLHCERDLGTK